MFLRTTSSVLAVMALSAPALADVTPAEVWQNWVDYYKANGYSVTEGSREQAGEVLMLRDVVIAYAAPEDDTRVEFRTPEILLTGTGDGRVRTTMAERSPATARFRDSDGEEITLNGTLTARDAEIVSGGTPGDMTHETRAGELALTLDSVRTAEGTRTVPASLRLLNATGRQQITDTDTMRFDAMFAADRAEFAVAYADPDTVEDPRSVNIASVLNGLQAASAGTLPKGVDMAGDMAGALRAGADVTATASARQGSLNMDAAGRDDQGQEEAVRVGSTLEGFELAVALGPDGMKYQGALDSSSTDMAGSGLPAPISYTVTEGTFDMQVPVLKSDRPAPFKFAYSIGELTLADSVWDLFDSARVLPRDPAHLDIDLTGLVRITMDLFDPALMSDSGNENSAAAGQDAPDAGEEMDNPFEPTEVAINKFAISALGASVDASGELKVPEGGSADQPVGAVRARLDGVNGLIDRLVQMGVIAPDEVAGYRLMLAMFARPAPEGDDALVAEFEFRENGQVFANGQQVK